jgi:hypothetical protein
MAEFCYDCIQSVFPEADPRENDLVHGFEGEVAWDVCEGCGAGWFDAAGRRVTVEDEQQSDDDQRRARGIDSVVQ